MNSELELEVWRGQWQAETAVPVDLHKYVERQSRLMKWGLLADVLVTVGMGGWVTTWAMTSKGSEIIQLAAATWIFLVAAWSFVLALSRGNWKPAALDTTSFLDLSLRRCRNALAMTWFAIGLFLIEVGFLLFWIHRYTSEARPMLTWLLFGSLRVDILWILTFVFTASMVWYRRKKRTELKRLLALRTELAIV